MKEEHFSDRYFLDYYVLHNTFLIVTRQESRALRLTIVGVNFHRKKIRMNLELIRIIYFTNAVISKNNSNASLSDRKEKKEKKHEFCQLTDGDKSKDELCLYMIDYFIRRTHTHAHIQIQRFSGGSLYHRRNKKRETGN